MNTNNSKEDTTDTSVYNLESYEQFSQKVWEKDSSIPEDLIKQMYEQEVNRAKYTKLIIIMKKTAVKNYEINISSKENGRSAYIEFAQDIGLMLSSIPVTVTGAATLYVDTFMSSYLKLCNLFNNDTDIKMDICYDIGSLNNKMVNTTINIKKCSNQLLSNEPFEKDNKKYEKHIALLQLANNDVIKFTFIAEE